MSEPKCVAISCSDIHLSDKAPVARSAEPDWFAAQRRVLCQLSELALNVNGPAPAAVPVLYAGDLFDRYNPSPALINLALENLPHGYGICGQHDLPHHNLADIRRSAFWTLVEAGKVEYVNSLTPTEVLGQAICLRLYGFSWDVPVKPLSEKRNSPFALEIALVHAYVWISGKGYLGAKPESRLKNLKQQLIGYDAVLIGDNHIHWSIKGGGKGFPVVWNNGCLIRRKADERDYVPCVGLIYSDGTVKRHKLDCSADLWLSDKKLAKVMDRNIDAAAFLEELSKLTDASIDFAEAVKIAMDGEGSPAAVREIVLRALEGGKK